MSHAYYGDEDDDTQDMSGYPLTCKQALDVLEILDVVLNEVTAYKMVAFEWITKGTYRGNPKVEKGQHGMTRNT